MSSTRKRVQDSGGSICILHDSNKAIDLNPNDNEAYHRRGLVKVSLSQQDDGCLDLSKAGELGYLDAYDTIKRYCN